MPKDQIQALDPARPITPQIAQLLRDRIIRNHLKPGDRISETEIARTYDVSRQPVREAFIKLSEQGLLAVLPQRGTIISKIAYQAVLDARFLREAVEADIVRILASTHDTAVITELRAQLAAQRAVPKDAPETFIRLDEQFHQTLADGAGKGDAWKLIEGVKSQMDRVRFLSLENFPVERLIQQHTAVVDTVEAQDVDGAEWNARRHLRDMLDYLPGVIAANPEFFDLPQGEITPSVNTPTNGGDMT